METMDGGWTAIQKRVDGSLDFDRNWADYKDGFGSPELDFWIGNEVIHQLTKGHKSSLYVSVTSVNLGKLYELYEEFSVSSEAEKYQLFLGGNATGTLGDQMLNTGRSDNDLSGMYFSTPDRDNDQNQENCASHNKGGWWFNYCHKAYLNGPWSPDRWIYPWKPPITYGKYVNKTFMMIRRHQMSIR
ncbi:fibroleukin-like [Saccostrea echinata]|uniref:fibroleukin-like n=1 Tax=Saccostrea echinata TaxID=191078 RepID=UPI002A7FA8F7|nr:fibroleukin-like [Saccostrea echinata]